MVRLPQASRFRRPRNTPVGLASISYRKVMNVVWIVSLLAYGALAISARGWRGFLSFLGFAALLAFVEWGFDPLYDRRVQRQRSLNPRRPRWWWHVR